MLWHKCPGLCPLGCLGGCCGAGGPRQSQSGWVGYLHHVILRVWLLGVGACFNSAFVDFWRKMNQDIDEQKIEKLDFFVELFNCRKLMTLPLVRFRYKRVTVILRTIFASC